MSHRLPPLAAAVLLAALAGPLLAYSEDICYFRVVEDGEPSADLVYYHPFNCFDMECLDGPEGSQNPASCAAAGLVQYLDVTVGRSSGGDGIIQGHSALHFDVLYLFARIAGLAADEALRLATYAESVDLGRYRPISQVVEGTSPRVATLGAGTSVENIDGLVRTNTATDGFWLHFVPWHADGQRQRHSVTVAAYRGFLADREATTFDEIERSLVHVRDWAFAGGGPRQLCKLGLTAAEGCAAGDVYVVASLLGDALVTEGAMALGWQEVRAAADGGYSEADGPALSGTVEALGVYLHVLGDRISHDLCLREAPLTAAAAGEDYDYTLSLTGLCGQVTHALRHYLETGHGADTPARTVTGMNLAVRELAEWTKVHGGTPAAPRSKAYPAFLVNGRLNEQFVKKLVGTAVAPGKAVAAAGEACANRRLAALCRLARDGYGVAWYDGNADCDFPSFPGDEECKGD